MKKANEEKSHKIKDFMSALVSAIKGVTYLAFIAANGIAAYVLWFSSDSLTLKVVSVILALHAATMAVRLSTKA